MSKPDPTISNYSNEYWGEQAEITFYRASEKGKVHVLKEKRQPDWVGMGGTKPHDLLVALHAVWVTRCGRRHHQYDQHIVTSHFNDEDICPSCVNATPTEEQPKLFEHPVDQDDSSHYS